MPTPERLSIELTNRCAKRCPFCYNASRPGGAQEWTAAELIAFCRDCAAHGSKAVSFGGGEPLEHPGLLETLEGVRGVLFRSMTSNGLLLDGAWIARLVEAGLQKAHLSIHFPQSRAEVRRVIAQVGALQAAGIASGVNLLAAPDRLTEARRAAEALEEAGIGRERIVFLPLRGAGGSSAEDLVWVAGGRPFQSMTCLGACGISPRFAAISWDKHAAWCSYTSVRRPLPSLDAAGLSAALEGLGLIYCGATPRAPTSAIPSGEEAR